MGGKAAAKVMREERAEDGSPDSRTCSVYHERRCAASLSSSSCSLLDLANIDDSTAGAVMVIPWPLLFSNDCLSTDSVASKADEYS